MRLKELGIEDEEEQPTGISEEKIAKMIQDAVSAIVPQIKPQDDELALANKKIEEIRLAFASKKTAPSSAGSNIDKDVSTVKSSAEKFFSPEQIADIKKKFPNISIEEVYKNMTSGKDEGKGLNA